MASQEKYLPPFSNLPRLLSEQPEVTFEDVKNEYDAMPTEDRRKVLRERYGLQLQEDDAIESPELVEAALSQMMSAIDLIEEKEAYETALFVNPDHVQDPDFKLAFLRAESFRAENAAQRYVTYWEVKVALFGIDRAFNSGVSTLDLLEEDYPALVKGGAQWQLSRDEAGRAIIFRYMKYGVGNADNMMRLNWFVLHSAILDPEFGVGVQKNGVVVLAAAGMDFRSFPSLESMQSYSKGLSQLEKALPIRTKCLHVFLPTSRVVCVRFLEQQLSSLTKKLRQRIVLHTVDSPESFVQSLEENYRIHRDAVPVELGGDLNFNYKHYIYDKVIDDVMARMGNVSVDSLPEKLKELLITLM